MIDEIILPIRNINSLTTSKKERAWTVNNSMAHKHGTEIDFKCLPMIDPASSWFEIVELPVTTDAVIPMDTKGKQAHRHIKILSYLTLISHQQ